MTWVPEDDFVTEDDMVDEKWLTKYGFYRTPFPVPLLRLFTMLLAAMLGGGEEMGDDEFDERNGR